MEPSSTRDIFISFKHQTQIDEFTKAYLIVKPRGISNSDRTFKSTVQLQAFAWESFKLGVVIDDQPVTSVMQLEGTIQLNIIKFRFSKKVIKICRNLEMSKQLGDFVTLLWPS